MDSVVDTSMDILMGKTEPTTAPLLPDEPKDNSRGSNKDIPVATMQGNRMGIRLDMMLESKMGTTRVSKMGTVLVACI